MTSQSRILVATVLVAVAMTWLAGCEGDQYHYYTTEPAPPGPVTVIDNSVSVQEQADLDALAGVRHISGSLSIYSNDVSDLSPLASLQSVEGLRIQSTSLTDLSGLDSLQTVGYSLEISYNEQLVSLAGLERLQGVQWFYLARNGPITDLEPLAGIIGLQGIRIDTQPGLQDLRGLSGTSGLQTIEIANSGDVVSLGIETPLPALEFLNLSNLPALTSLGLAQQLPQFRSCRLRDLPALAAASLDWRNLTELELTGSLPVQDLAWIGEVPTLRHLAISNVSSLRSLAGLAETLELSDILLDRLPALTSLAGLVILDDRPGLAIRYCTDLTDLSMASSQLEFLQIDGCGIADLASLEPQLSCQRLELRNCSQLVSLEGLGQLGALRDLDIDSCNQLASLGETEELLSLEQIDIADNDALTDLAGIAACPSLNTLHLTGCSALQTLAGLPYPDQLTYIGISECQSLTSLAGLEAVRSLQYALRLMDNPTLSSLQELENLEWLRDLYIVRNPSLPRQEINDLLDRILVTGTVTYGENGS